MIEDPRYPEGIRLFQDGHYFEAHEELELVWRATPPGATKLFLQALIQFAVSLEHWRRANPRGARGQWDKARQKTVDLPAEMEGIDLAGLLADFEGFYAPWNLDKCVDAQMAGTWVLPSGSAPYPRPEWCDRRVQPPR